MKLTDYIIFYLCIAMVFIGVIFMNISLQSKAQVVNSEYSNKLASACVDAAATIDMNKIQKEGAAWHDIKDREETLDIFYTTLAYCFNKEYTVEKEGVRLFTPVVAMIDMDGFYISHDYAFDKSGAVVISRDNGSILNDYTDYMGTDVNIPLNGLTALNTWSRTFYKDEGSSTIKYNVRFYLNDYVEVTILPSFDDLEIKGKVIYGDRDDVYTQIDKLYGHLNRSGYSLESIEFLKRENDGHINPKNADAGWINIHNVGNTSFETVKTDVIIKELNAQIEYYINEHNSATSQEMWPQKYTFTMPEISGEDWSRLLQNPTVISFLQGRSVAQKNKIINIYSLSGGELMQKYHYFIDENDYYHCLEGKCLDSAGNNRIEKKAITKKVFYKDYTDHGKPAPIDKERETTVYVNTFDGKIINTIYPSMEECSKVKPCQACKCVYDLNGL